MPAFREWLPKSNTKGVDILLLLLLLLLLLWMLLLLWLVLLGMGLL